MRDRGESYCGIYCGACSILRHGETGRGDDFISCCGLVPRAELSCGGCKSDRVYAGCRVCSFRDCAVQRGVEHCVACADYPCQAYRRWQRSARLLPHVNEAAGNLAAIERDGVEAWISAQRLRWSCPTCGTPFSWYQTACGSCGGSIPPAYALNGLRKLVCRALLPLVYRRGRAKTRSRA